ncbi:MAG: glutamine amidotransferase [Candidatus Nanopelagicaceae bacterium]|nr:glutamine amidotransferase [Candidatus Nanopelagicaceae bacterium]
MTLSIIHLLPELLGTYGDRGNVDVLSWRLKQRDIAHEVLTVGVGDRVPTGADLYLLGGGEDDAQIAAREILARKDGMKKALENGAHIFAVCAGFQILGKSFPASGGRIVPGLELIAVETISAEVRSVGEVISEPTMPVATLTGFENHGGQTRFLEELQPLGRVRHGVGNGAGGGVEGLITDQIVATYMHGPALARNPELADWILERKLGAMLPIDAPIFEQLHDERVHAVSR